jgi:NAD(P)-dependent dehydrogenase (short-subunit alcohol dehydrogenase family)
MRAGVLLSLVVFEIGRHLDGVVPRSELTSGAISLRGATAGWRMYIGTQDTPPRARDTPEQREALLSLIPTRLLGRPEDLAQVVVFLAAPESVNITGVILSLDGGHSI